MHEMTGTVIDAPTLGSLYSGIGGWDLAFTLCGWRPAWQCEIHPYRQRVLQAHFPDVRRFADGTDSGWAAPPVDCLVAACPTQTYADGSAVHEAVWRRLREAAPVWAIVETTSGHPEDGAYAVAQMQAAGYEVEVVPALHGSRDHGDPVNWLRLLLVGRRVGTPGTDAAWATFAGAAFGSGEIFHEANGQMMQRYGWLGVHGGDAWMAAEVTLALGYPDGWLVEGDALEMSQAVRDTTAVPIALDVARVLSRPAWKEAPCST